MILLWNILAWEQRSFVSRVKGEIAGKGLQGERRVESLEFEVCLHGWIECERCFACLSLRLVPPRTLLAVPSFAIDESTRTRGFDAAIEFLKEAHRACGWIWDER